MMDSSHSATFRSSAIYQGTRKNTAITQTVDIYKLAKAFPLRTGHYVWLFAQAITGPYYTAQKFALYFLFVQTSSGCDFKHDFAFMAMISIFSESLAIPITGYICDRFKRWNHYLLIGTFAINVLLSIVLYTLFLGKWTTSQNVVIAVNIAQSLIRMQFNNSLYKLTKLYIEYDTKFTDCIMDTPRNEDQCNNIQMAYFTKIGIWGRFVQQLIFAAMVIPGFLIMKHRWWTFKSVEYFIFSFVIGFGVFIVALSLKIAMIFRRNEEIWGISKYKEYLINSVQRHSSDSMSHRFSGGSYIDSDGNSRQFKSNSCGSMYFCRSFKMLFIENRMTRNGIINVILVFLLADLLSSYEPLTIAGVDTDDDHQTLSNFCGDFLTNLMYQQCWSSLFIAIGALLYLFVLLPFVDTLQFYRFVYPISSIMVGAAVFVISGVFRDGVDQTWLSVSLGFLLAFFTYAHQFDDFLNLGYINKEAVGFYQIVYSWSNNVWQIFGYLFVYLDVLDIAVAAMIGILLISSVIQSIYFSRLFIPKSIY